MSLSVIEGEHKSPSQIEMHCDRVYSIKYPVYLAVARGRRRETMVSMKPTKVEEEI
jgi:hypothetical protein